MDIKTATEAFSALSQPMRLDVFRLLVKAGENGMLSGEIGTALEVKQNTMSANLAILLQAGLVRNERHGRAIRYFANIKGMQDLLTFLLQDCCGSRPDLCQPLVRTLGMDHV
ncbi:ArsR/SmtB family transcription factor [Parasulfitobacter algicola]|uniref:Helix-turn-helix transcriptional regulator n=1 Tax=Parasulfitobacter algicola TaxID=2614809 RepID=A0ABX2IQK3_9RHOB|nr:metalloregulator ArsR/SmtB family transcription factor [Sulfitobacter algicola]NSX54825.1 helix-turn-helix transcriptional regulator [Sulfitobacter algicola]